VQQSLLAVAASPIALEAVRRFDAIFDVEREITGLSAETRHEARRQRVAPMVNDLHGWMRAERARMRGAGRSVNAIFSQITEDHASDRRGAPT
jgi:transposase